MTYEKTKEYIMNHYIKDTEYFFKLKKKLNNSSLTSKEELFLNVHYLCRQLYEGNDFDVKEFLTMYNIKQCKNGWFYVKRDFGEGYFINADAIFDNVDCEVQQCHSKAYLFALKYKGQDVVLVSGLINPYNIDDGILHSICIFKMNDKSYVFDGANFLIMEKNLYYDLFNFTEKQRITKTELMEDRILLSYAKIPNKSMLKTKEKLQRPKNYSLLSKRFEGLGFTIYLYDRKSTLKNKQPLNKLVKENRQAMKILEEKTKDIEEQEDLVE